MDSCTKAKIFCADIFKALSLRPYSWSEKVEEKGFEASAGLGTQNCSVTAFVGYNGEYVINVQNARRENMVALAAGTFTPIALAEGLHGKQVAEIDGTVFLHSEQK